jgi:hypothetical protein
VFVDNGSEGALVEGAADAEGAAVEDVGVDHRGGDVAVAEELLNGADVVCRFFEPSQLAREGAGWLVWSRWLGWLSRVFEPHAAALNGAVVVLASQPAGF